MITVTHTYAGNFIIPPAIQNRRRQGVPPGGPADPYLSAIALYLAKSDTCLEITSPITLTTDEPTQIALAAPPNSLCLPTHPTTSLALIPLLPGEPLTFHSPQSGYRLYLSWPGLTSPSRFPQPITTNLKLAVNPAPNPKFIAFDQSLNFVTQKNLTYLPLLSTEPNEMPTSSSLRRQGSSSEKTNVEIACTVTPHISRIGTRIVPLTSPLPLGEGLREGPLLNPLIRSEPSLHGAIQVTPDRQFLIHGPDGPTLGGYPKLGAIIQASQPILAQLRPNQAIQLQETTLKEAHQARHGYQQQLAQTLAQIDRALSIAL